MKKLLSLFFVSLFVLTACSETGPDGKPVTASSENPNAEVIRMGYVGPLTGDVASIGQDEKATIEMWLEQNPEIDGKKVEVVFEDGKCNGQEAASAAQKLIAINKVQVILGGLCSGETLGMAPVAEDNEVLVFSSISTSPEVTTAGDYVFRNAPSDAKSSEFMTTLVAAEYTKAALITQNNDYSAAYRKALQERLPNAGVELVVDEAFNSGTTDFKTILQKVKESEAQVLLVIPGEAAPGGFIVKQAVELGIELPMFGGDVLVGAEFFEIGKDAAEGVKIVIMAADESDPAVAQFMSDFKAFTGREPNTTAYMLLDWDKMNILKMAIESVGYDGTALKDYLYEMEGYEGMGGLTKFDENGDVGLNPALMVAKDGKFVLYNENDAPEGETEESETAESEEENGSDE